MALSYEEWKSLRDQGYSNSQITSGEAKPKTSTATSSSGPLDYSEWKKLRDQGYSTKDITSGAYKPKTPNSIGLWNSTANEYADWIKKQSTDVSKWDTTQASKYSRQFSRYATDASNYLKDLERHGLKAGDEDYDNAKQAYDYFSGQAQSLTQGNRDYAKYRDQFMYQDTDGKYLTYDQAKEKAQALQEEMAGMKPKDRRARQGELDALNEWTAQQDTDREFQDFLKRYYGNGQSQFENFEQQKAAADQRVEDLNKQMPQREFYAITDELGNWVDTDEDRYEADLAAWRQQKDAADAAADEAGKQYAFAGMAENVEVDTRTKLQRIVDTVLGVDSTQVTGGKTDVKQLFKGIWQKGLSESDYQIASGIDFLFGGLAEEIHSLGVTSINDAIDTINMFRAEDNQIGYVENKGNIITRWANKMRENREYASNQYQENANTTRAAQIVDKFGASTVAAIPMAIEAIVFSLMSGGAYGATQLGSAGTAGLEYFSGLQSAQGMEAAGMMAKQGMTKLVQDPQFWSSYVNVLGTGYEDAVNDGMNQDDAAIYAMVNGFFNAMIEVGGADEALGGIQNLPMRLQQEGGKNAVVEWFKGTVLGEGKEEVLQGLFERGFRQAQSGASLPEMFSVDPNNTEATFNPFTSGQEFMGGAVVGGLLGGGQVALQSGRNAAVNARNQQQVKKEITNVTGKQLNATTSEIQQLMKDYKIKDPAQVFDLASLLNIESVEEFRESYKDAADVKEGLAKIDQAIKDSDYDRILDYSTEKQRNRMATQMTDLESTIQGYREELKNTTDTEKKSELNDKIREAEGRLSELQEKILSDGYRSYSEEEKSSSVEIDGKNYTVSGMTMEDGDAKVKLESPGGNTQIMEIDDTRLPEAFRSLAVKVKSLDWASAMAFEHYKPGTDVNDYVRRAQNIRTYAAERISREAFMNTAAVKALNDPVLAEFLYSRGQEIYNERQSAVKKVAKTIERNMEKAAEKTGTYNVRTKGKGRVDTTTGADINGKHYDGIQGMKLNKTQTAVVNMVDTLANTLNIDYVIFNGDQGGVQGVYRKGGQIFLNINAGKNVRGSFRALAAETLSHELTHFIEDFAPKEYESLRDAVVQAMFSNDEEKFNKRVERAAANLGADFKGDRQDAAIREVVADACTTMLQNSEAVTELARQNMTAAQKIQDFIDETIEKIRTAITEAFAESDPEEYREERKLIAADLDNIQQLWDDGLHQAQQGYNAQYTLSGRSYEQVAKDVEEGNAIPPDEEVQYSTANDEKYMDKADEKNKEKMLVSQTVMDKAREDRATIRDIFRDPEMAEKLKLPEDRAGNTFLSNSSYGGTEENSTVCPRSLAAQALMDEVSSALGRPLSVQDTLVISQDIMNYIKDPECIYCYVAQDRRAYRGFLGEYIKQRDAALQDLSNGMDEKQAYEKFLAGRKDTKEMKARFKLWQQNAATDTLIKESDVASLEKLFAELDNKETDKVRLAQLKDAAKYAQSASWAKKIMSYTAYNNHILRWGQQRINNFNKHYGLRMYSFSDFSPAFILENMQMITDAAVKGLKVLAYTKEIAFAKIFAKTGANINISVYATEVNGEILQDEMMGAKWNEAIELRKQYPNIGLTLVATNDRILEWGLNNPDVDVVIPYHLVRTGQEVVDFMNKKVPGSFKNYTSVSADGKIKGLDYKGKQVSVYPSEHQNDLIKYVDRLAELDLTPRFADYLQGLDEYRAGTITEQQFRDMNPNYMKLVNETRQSSGNTPTVQPIFDVEAAKEAIDQLAEDGGYNRSLLSYLGKNEKSATRLLNRITENVRTAAEARGDQYQVADDVDALFEQYKSLTQQANDYQRQRLELERSDEYGELFDRVNQAKGRDESKAALEAMKEWISRTGYEDIAAKEKQARADANAANKAYYSALEQRDIEQEQKDIEKSGLSPEDYFRKKAVKEFGYTPYFYDAGYILPNGKMLNFSGEKGKHYGVRGQDHRGISTIYASSESGSAAMNRFMQDGNIRIMAESPGVDLATAIEPTAEQYAVIRKFVREFGMKNDYFNVDLTDASGRTVGNYEYDGNISPTKVIADIQYYFANGQVRDNTISQFHDQFQTSDDWDEGVIYNNRALVSEQTLDRWLDAYAARNPNYAQAYVTYMTPDDFLRMTTTDVLSRMRIEEDSQGFTPEQVVKASKGQPIFLDIDTETGKVEGHEGRHRMVALKRQGINEVPVLLFDYSTKYSKTPMNELVLTGQDFGDRVNIKNTIVYDLQPLSTGNKDVIAEKFGQQTKQEQLSEKYAGKRSLQFQQAEGVEDTAYEAKGRAEALNDLRAENKILQEAVEQLRKQNKALARETKLSGYQVETRLSDARKLAQQIIRETDSSIDKNDLARSIKEVADVLSESANIADYEYLKTLASGIARDVMSNISVEMETGAEEIRNDMKAALKGKAIYVPEQYRSVTGDWNAFKQQYRNIMTFRNNGTPIDKLYASLANDLPGVLDKNITSPEDMLMEIAGAWDSAQSTYGNPFEDYMSEVTEHYANMILQSALEGTIRPLEPTYADKMNARIDRLRKEKNARIEEVRRQGIAKKQEAIAKEKAAKWKKVDKTAQYYRDMQARAKQRRENTAMRGRIRDMIGDINTRLLHGTEKKYVPAELVNATIDILNLIDLDPGKRGGERFHEKIAKLQQEYAKLKNDETFKQYSYDENMREQISALSENIGDTPLRKMSNEQLELVLTTLKDLTYMIQNSVSARVNGENYNFYETGKSAIKSTNGAKTVATNALANAGNWYATNTMRPDVVFDRFGGFAKGNEWQKLAELLNKAQQYGMDLQMTFAQPFEELMSKKYKDDLKRLTSTKAEDMLDIGLKDENGDTIKVTRDFALFVYMNLFNEDNIRHIMRGGIMVPEIKEYLSGKGDRGYGRGVRHAVGISLKLSEIDEQIANTTDEEELEGLKQQRNDILNEGEIYVEGLRKSIEKQLTPYDKKWVDAWWKFQDRASEALNKTTMEVYGRKKFQVENYFPIITDRNFLNVPMETIIKDMSLENAGFTKERLSASNPIRMMGLSDVINMQANRTAQYAAIMPAVRAFNKIYNTTLPGYASSLRKALNDKFGSEATKFVENLLSDLQGGRKTDFTIFDKLRGRMAQATLSLNPRVALAQTASFPTAIAELGWKPVMKALTRGGKKNWMFSAADRDLIAKYSSALWYRARGYATPELGDVKNMQQMQHKVMDRVGWAMNWIQFMDTATVGRLWYAAQYYVDDNFSDLAKGTDEYYTKVAEVFNRVVEHTQPNYTTMQRPELLRNPDKFMRTLSMFMTQRLQNQSILYGATAKYMKYRSDLASGKNGVTEADVKQAGIDAARAVTSQVAATATIVVFKALSDALLHRMNGYRDKDKKLTPESVSLTMLNNFAESIVSNVWLGSELYSVVKSIVTKEKYYGMSLSGISTLTEALENIVKFGQKPSWKLAKKMGESVAQFYGIPAENAEKIGMAIWYWMQDAMNGEFMESGVERSNAQNAKLLTEAFLTNDQTAIDKYKATFKDEDSMMEAVRDHIKSGYVVQKGQQQTISKEMAVDLLVKSGMYKKDAQAKVQEWTCEIVTGIPYSKIKDEYMAGNITGIRASELLQTYGGRDKDSADKTVRYYACEKATGIAYNDLKDAYLEGRITKNQLTDAYRKYGLLKPAEAENKVTYYEYLKLSPDSDVSQERAVGYMNIVKPTGLSVQAYETALYSVDADKNGSFSQDEVGKYLQGKNFTEAQNEALWETFGNNWKSSYDTWQVKTEADAAGTGKGANNGNASQEELGYYLVQEIRAGRMTQSQAEKYWKAILTTSKKDFAAWCRSKRIGLG